jgi:hypothetical protein
MKEELLTLLAGIPYEYEHGPLIEQADAVEEGANCQLVFHIVMEELGYAFPKWMRSSELYEDTEFLFEVDPGEEGWKIGDVLFSYDTQAVFDPRLLHLSVCIAVETGTPQFIHAVKFKDAARDAVVVWTLDDFSSSKKHQQIVGVKRLKTSSKTRGIHVNESF